MSLSGSASLDAQGVNYGIRAALQVNDETTSTAAISVSDSASLSGTAKSAAFPSYGLQGCAAVDVSGGTAKFSGSTAAVYLNEASDVTVGSELTAATTPAGGALKSASITVNNTVITYKSYTADKELTLNATNYAPTNACTAVTIAPICVMTVELDKTDYDAGESINANIYVKALDAAQDVASVQFTPHYDSSVFTLSGIDTVSGWTADSTSGETRMIESSGGSTSISADGVQVATVHFIVNSDAADNCSASVSLANSEIKLADAAYGFTPAVTGDSATVHNIVVTLRPSAGAILTDSNHTQGTDPINAYAKYGAAGLFSNAGRTTTFTMPTVTETPGYRLAKGTADEPLWKVSGGTTTYADNDAVLAAAYSTSTTLDIQVVQTYTVTITSADGGTLSPNKSSLTVDTGSALMNQLPTAAADGNHTFAGWYIKASGETGEDTLVDENTTVTADITVEARFTAKSYTWTAPTGDHFTCTVRSGVSNDGKITYGTPVFFDLTAEEGYVIDTVTYHVAGGESYSLHIGDVYTISSTKITGDVTVTVTTAERCTITFESVEGVAALSDTPTYYGKIGKAGLYFDEACANLFLDVDQLPTITYTSGDGWQYAPYSSNIWSYSGASKNVCDSSFLLGDLWVNSGNITVKPNVVKQYLITLAVDDLSHATITARHSASSPTTSWANENAYLVNMGAPTITYAPGYVFKSFTFGGKEYTTWTNGRWMDSVTVTKADSLTLNTQPGTYAVTFPETITGAALSDKTGVDATTGKATFNQNVTFKVTDMMREMMSMNEAFANRAAGYLLMPRFLVERTLKKYNDSKKFITYDGYVMPQETKLLIQSMADSLGVNYTPLKPTMVNTASHKKVIWYGKCGHEWSATVKSRSINGTGCPYCSHNIVLPGFNDLESQQPEVAAEWSERNFPLLPSMVTAYTNQAGLSRAR